MLGSKKEKLEAFEEIGEGLDLTLSDFLMENADPSKGYIARLFRCADNPRGKVKPAFLQTWHDRVPEYEEIADGYGPGTYRLNLIYSPPGKPRTATARMIHIDPEWGGTHAARSRVLDMAGSVAGGTNNGAQQSQQLLQMFGMFLDTLAKFAEAKQGNGHASEPSPLAALADMQKAMGESLISNYQTQSKLVDRVIRDRLDVGAEEPAIDDGAPFVVQAVQWCMAAWQKYGSQILASPKMAGGFLKPKAQGIPQIDYALSHPDEYEQLYNQFATQSGAPAESIDTFIHALGYPTPAELKAQSQQPESAGQ